MKVRVSARARRELRNAISYLAQRNPIAARRVRDEIYKAISTLSDFPYRGQRIPTGDLRRVVRSPYIIFYEVSAQEVLIVRILHGVRDLDAELDT